ncbi:hypothetical protein BDW02DRAFT_199495 [Decorospora gaudefroyi]|uniref:F-box domain-containing protein n=1 Tax=Decorospora gaudefroyi TaxID=184978 RepID=A0A6A5JWE7_9PLEO|nr:hypothetical protein BDW02DRAFT_199495 [Decorospora gaudefroyi]
MEFRVAILSSFFRALAKTGKVKSLTIKHLQDCMRKELFASADFVAVRQRLRELHLMIATESNETAPALDIDLHANSRGFDRSLPRFWLQPTTPQLTRLTLYSTECFWGVWPFTDLRAIPPFPKLVSLSLGNFTIAHDWQIDWVVSHGATLKELILDDCLIVTALRMDRSQTAANFPEMAPLRPPKKDEDSEDSENSENSEDGHENDEEDGGGEDERDDVQYLKEVDLRWYQVLDRFGTNLPLLQRFDMGSGDWQCGNAFEERYDLKSQIPYGSIV